MIGSKFGPYEITEEIGKGGMATVYRAYQPSMDRHVAVKVIRASMLGDEIGRDRFQREAKLVAKLEHPHLLPVYDFDGAHDPPYIVMRFLEGGTLKQVMEAEPLPAGEMLYMLRQVATALDYAHRQGVVHRDLKPSNIMIDKEGNAFIADFGIAQVSDAAKDLTGTGNVIGTPGYMAPEQARGKVEIDGRADVYALGVITYELLAGQGPFDRESALEELMAHLQEPVPDITEANPDLGQDVNAVIQGALDKDRERRPANAGELVDELSKALKKQASSAPAKLRTMTQTFASEQLAALEDAPAEETTPSDVQRQMTALYMDVTDFADLLYEKEETDVVRQEVDRLWHAFKSIAEDHGGALESRTGEAGLLLWGRYETREGDPEQAIRAALRMKESIEKAVIGHWGESDEPLPFQAGVTTGPVLLARSDSGDTTASGATITLAGRLKESAPPGDVLVSHDSFTHVRGVFDVSQLPPVRMRGRADPVEVYIAVQARPRAFRLQARGIEGVETKMIGREPELKILQDALSLTIEDSETQVVTVVGDAGVGKSRLLYEFSNWIDVLDERLWFFEARATQPSMLQPYSLTRDLFSFRFQILDNDPLSVVHQKFEEGVAGFMNGRSHEAAHMIGQLVGFDFSESEIVKPKLDDPDAFHQQALEHLGEFFITASKTNAVFIQVEDIHWADERSLDLLNSLARENTEIPLFIIYMARPGLYDRRPSWGEGQEFHARITLPPLSRLDSRRLVRELLKKIDKVPSALRDLIIDRAEGNPFYMEELVKALIDDGVILKGEYRWHVEMDKLARVRVPATLVGVLQSRLDSFPPGQRSLLQRASVVGRIFWESAAAHLSEAEGVTSGAVSSMLNDLRKREMVFKREESAFEGTAEYGFRHAILRDVVYETIVPSHRRKYHKQVADWLSEAGKNRRDEYNLLIAEHFERADQPDQAALYLRDSADNMRVLGGHLEAVRVLQRAIGILDDEAQAESRAGAQALLGRVYAELGQYDNAKEQLEPALETARKAGDLKTQLDALSELGRVIGTWQGDFETGQGYFDEAMPIARELDDKPSLAFILRQLGNMATHRDDLDPAQAYLEESVELAREIGHLEAVAAGMNSIGNVATLRGDYAKGIEIYEEALEQARQLSYRGMQSMTLINISGNQRSLKHFTEATSSAQQALKLALETGSDYLIFGGHAQVGFAYLQDNQDAKAREHLMESLSTARAMGSTAGILQVILGFARLRAHQDDVITAIEWVGHVKSHPDVDSDGKLEVKRALEELGGELSPDELEVAMERGSKLNLEAVLAEIEGE